MTWQTQPIGAGVVLATNGTDDDGNSTRVTFSYECEAPKATELKDFEEALDGEQVVLDILNSRLARNAVENSPGKSDVRELVRKVEEEILADEPNIDPEELVTRIGDDKRVKQAIKEHRKQVADFMWSGARGEISATAAGNIGKALLKQDPDRLKELAAELGLEGFGS